MTPCIADCVPATVSRAAARAAIRAAALALAACGAARADPADYVFVPYTVPGTVQVAWGAGARTERGSGIARGQTLAVGWTPSPRWSTQVYAGWAADPGGALHYDEWAWLTQFLLTPADAGPGAAALLCGLERPHARAEGTGILCAALLQLDTDRLQFNVNPLLERRFGASEPAPATLSYQWQAKTLVRPGLEIGAQGLGSLGAWNRWAPPSQQTHLAGPAVFARTRIAGHLLALDAAWLTGAGPGPLIRGWRLRVQQSF